MRNESYTPAWWLPGPHLQTFWGKFFRRLPLQPTWVERLETADDDFIDLHHLDGPSGAPLLLLLHGLEGTIRSHYIQALLAEARQRRWRAAVLIFRSCGDEPNRTRRFYHSGETSDLDLAITHLRSTFPASPLVLGGASLGGNVLLKYLGEKGASVDPMLKGAAAISVPFDLSRSSRHISAGFARVYQWHFVRKLKRKVSMKRERFPDVLEADRLEAIRTLFEFDEWFTAPIHGFHGAEDYYSRSSSLQWLGRISINTLLLSAVDDPFLPAQVLDEVRAAVSDNPCLHLETPGRGGHVGFVEGRIPFAPAYYIERRVGDFLAQHLEPEPVRA